MASPTTSKRSRLEYGTYSDFKIVSCSKPRILTLPDELVLMILRFLSTPDLLNLRRCARRLLKLCDEIKFWSRIVNPPDKRELLEVVFNKINPKTEIVKLTSPCHSSNNGFRSSFTESQLASITDKCNSSDSPQPQSQLKELHIIGQKIDGKSFKLEMLPPSLKILCMNRTTCLHIQETSFYFRDISHHLLELEFLDLSECSTWVTSHALLALSKLPALNTLKLRGCRRIGNCLAYVSLASRLGFKSLKVLDVTDSICGGTELTAFGMITTLEELYIGQYDAQTNIADPNPIGDICFTALRNCRNLKILDVSGSSITDAVFEILPILLSLRQLDAHFTNLTVAGIERFQRLVPTCRINKVRDVYGEVLPVQHVINVDDVRILFI